MTESCLSSALNCFLVLSDTRHASCKYGKLFFKGSGLSLTSRPRATNRQPSALFQVIIEGHAVYNIKMFHTGASLENMKGSAAENDGLGIVTLHSSLIVQSDLGSTVIKCQVMLRSTLVCNLV